MPSWSNKPLRFLISTWILVHILILELHHLSFLPFILISLRCLIETKWFLVKIRLSRITWRIYLIKVRIKEGFEYKIFIKVILSTFTSYLSLPTYLLVMNILIQYLYRYIWLTIKLIEYLLRFLLRIRQIKILRSLLFVLEWIIILSDWSAMINIWCFKTIDETISIIIIASASESFIILWQIFFSWFSWYFMTCWVLIITVTP